MSARIYILVFLVSAAISSCAVKKRTEPQENGTSTLKNSNEERFLEFKFYYAEGLKEKMLGNSLKARTCFDKCLSLDNKSAAVNYQLALLEIETGDLARALIYTQKSVKHNAQNVWYQSLLAQLLVKTNRLDEAAKVYEVMIATLPQSSNIYVDLASLYSNSGHLNEAIKVYSTLEEKFGVSESTCLSKNSLYMKVGKVKEAENELLKLIKAFPGEFRYLGILAEFYTNQKMYEKAKDAYQRILKIEPNNTLVKYSLANFYLVTDERSKAFPLLMDAFEDSAIEIDTKLKMLQVNYPYSFDDSVRNNQAIHLVQVLVRNYPNEALVYLIYADYQIKFGKIESARTQLRHCAKLSKSNFQVWAELLRLNAELNDYKSLLEDSNSALELFPNQALIYLYNGIANFFLQSYTSSYEILSEGVDNVADNPGLLKEFYKYLGEVTNRIGNVRKSYDYFEKFLAIDNSDKFVLNNYSYYLAQNNDSLSKALHMIKLCIELEPLNSVYLDTYSWVLFKMKRYDEAAQIMEKAMNYGGSDRREVVEHYGDILFKMGKVDEALKKWVRSRQLGNNSPQLIKKIENKSIIE
jgi:predicted Zn-dependent protease